MFLTLRLSPLRSVLQMAYVRRDSLTTPFGMTPRRYHRDDWRLQHEFQPYVRFACGETQFDVSLSLLKTSETITRLFEDLEIVKSAADGACTDKSQKKEQDDTINEEKDETMEVKQKKEDKSEPVGKPVVLNDEPIEIPFDAELFQILLRCQIMPGLENIALDCATFETLAYLLQMAEYLNMPDRIVFFARSMSDMIEDKSPSEVAMIIGIDADYIPNEDKKTRSSRFPMDRPSSSSQEFY